MATVILVSGTNSFTINGAVYPLDSVAFDFNSSDNTYAGMIALPNSPIVTMRLISEYSVNGVTAANKAALTTFYTTYMVSSSGTPTVLGAITSVNSIAAVGNGVPVIVAKANLRAQSTAQDVLDFTPVTSGKTYKLEFSGYVTTTRLNSITLSYTDQNGNAVSAILPVINSTGGTPYSTLVIAANWGASGVRFYGFSAIFSATTATHIKLTTAVSGTPSYDMDVVLYQLN